ncbi:MAG: carbohydrate ABC transporter permease [Lachnospiraceae bacterium]|nr:carbohydrate ABC transporter permease [Lachnospiraceae bacterium]
MQNSKVKTGQKRNRLVSDIVLFIVLCLVAVIMVVPFVWMVSASFKNNNEIFLYPIRWIPNPVRLNNYINVWTQIPLLKYFSNTLIYSVIVTVGQIITCSMAAYAFGKLRFPGRDAIFLVYLATMMVPWHAIMIPQFIINKSLGFYNKPASIIVMNLVSAFGVFLMRQFMMGIPDDLCEAGRIDGCSEFGNFSKIMLPLCGPGVATLTVFEFTFMWNDYLAPMIYLDDDKYKTIQLGLAGFRSLYKTDYGLIMAGTVCSLIPILIIYCVAQKYLIEGIAFSGLKG